MIKDLEDKVIRAAQNLQAELANKSETTLSGSAAQPAATCVTTAEQPASAGNLSLTACPGRLTPSTAWQNSLNLPLLTQAVKAVATCLNFSWTMIMVGMMV